MLTDMEYQAYKPIVKSVASRFKRTGIFDIEDFESSAWERILKSLDKLRLHDIENSKHMVVTYCTHHIIDILRGQKLRKTYQLKDPVELIENALSMIAQDFAVETKNRGRTMFLENVAAHEHPLQNPENNVIAIETYRQIIGWAAREKNPACLAVISEVLESDNSQGMYDVAPRHRVHSWVQHWRRDLREHLASL